ncbi:MAG TPA: hypothetical protein VEI02_03025 [Planctomycetota bacterium]|nr:hypothetical protein [Planctomycetota bacterium]
MRLRTTLPLLILAVVTVFSHAQVTATAGPPVVPLGGTVWVSVANDTPNEVFLSSPCNYQVLDAGGLPVFAPVFCTGNVVQIPAGGVFSTTWSQVDNAFAQVPAGNYTVLVFHPGGPTPVPIVVSATEDAGIAQLGTARIGTVRNLALVAPAHAGFAYVVAAAFSTTPGLGSCAGVVPLAADALLTMSLTPGNGVFFNFTGVLDVTGGATTPAIAVPNLPALIGLSFPVAFVVVDPTAPCFLRSISAPTTIVMF